MKKQSDHGTRKPLVQILSLRSLEEACRAHGATYYLSRNEYLTPLGTHRYREAKFKRSQHRFRELSRYFHYLQMSWSETLLRKSSDHRDIRENSSDSPLAQSEFSAL